MSTIGAAALALLTWLVTHSPITSSISISVELDFRFWPIFRGRDGTGKLFASFRSAIARGRPDFGKGPPRDPKNFGQVGLFACAMPATVEQAAGDSARNTDRRSVLGRLYETEENSDD